MEHRLYQRQYRGNERIFLEFRENGRTGGDILDADRRGKKG
jgi:hypothetical protein